MSSVIRVPADLLEMARRDLMRPHPFAAERVGIYHARVAQAGEDGWLMLPYVYHPLADERYIEDRAVGARVDGAAIREQMQFALTEGDCIMHVHMHPWKGTPRLSRTDWIGLPSFVRAMANARPEIPHAAIVLSPDSACAIVLCPGVEDVTPVHQIVVVDRPMRFLSGGDNIYA
jgi:hypothetical protein